MHRDGATSQALAETLWPGLRPRTVTHRLHTTISELRRTLHTVTGMDVVHRHDERYRLHPDMDVDLWHLHAAVTDAATALTPTTRHTACRAVIDAYAGDLAAGQSWPWLDGPREAVRRHVIDAYASLADTSGPDDAVALLQDAIKIDPLNELLHLRAVQDLTAAGDASTATAVLNAYLQRLARLGIQPSRELLLAADDGDDHAAGPPTGTH